MEDINTVKQKIIDCINILYAEDIYLFNCDVCERCLMFRLAYYLQNKFNNYFGDNIYFVDCEFNKMGVGPQKRDPKVETNKKGTDLKPMYADIIIYNRKEGTQLHNFICIEIKKDKEKIPKDVKRLKEMTNKAGLSVENSDNYTYAYDFGFLIYLENDKYEIRSFQNGKEV
jgi:hypothetical protein